MAYGKWSIYLDDVPIKMVCGFKMVMFHSYVKQPKGNSW